MPKRLLIVDDDEMLLNLYSLEMEKRDHDVQVHLARDGEEAMVAIDAIQPDVLLLDLRLPKADGFAILKHLHEKQYRFPVLIVTNYDREQYRDMCRQYEEVHEYLIKNSILIEQLIQKLEQYLYQEKSPVRPGRE